MWRKKPKKRITVKARVELERRFLGSILKNALYKDARENVAYWNDRIGINWRNFRDRRHRALWRAFEVLDLKSFNERWDILEKEEYEKTAEWFKERHISFESFIDPDMDIVRGLPGSSDDQIFKIKMIKGVSDNLFWLERELEAAGALSVIGGKKYLREIAEIGECECLSTIHLAEDLFGVSLSIPETKKEGNDIFSGFSEEEVFYLESLRNSASAEDRKKFIEVTDAKRIENKKANKEVFL
jgi:hypothetical protein